jgi:serine/threonine protein kinase
MTSSGETIGPYTLGECLGSGGFGAVYAGTHQETGQRVAIKFLHHTRELEPEIQNRFVREVALLQRLDHENIVRIFDAGLHDGRIYCAMELVECGSLKEVLTLRHQLPWREATEVALQVCYATPRALKRAANGNS